MRALLHAADRAEAAASARARAPLPWPIVATGPSPVLHAAGRCMSALLEGILQGPACAFRARTNGTALSAKSRTYVRRSGGPGGPCEAFSSWCRQPCAASSLRSLTGAGDTFSLERAADPRTHECSSATAAVCRTMLCPRRLRPCRAGALDKWLRSSPVRARPVLPHRHRSIAVSCPPCVLGQGRNSEASSSEELRPITTSVLVVATTCTSATRPPTIKPARVAHHVTHHVAGAGSIAAAARRARGSGGSRGQAAERRAREAAAHRSSLRGRRPCGSRGWPVLAVAASKRAHLQSRDAGVRRTMRARSLRSPCRPRRFHCALAATCCCGACYAFGPNIDVARPTAGHAVDARRGGHRNRPCADPGHALQLAAAQARCCQRASRRSGARAAACSCAVLCGALTIGQRHGACLAHVGAAALRRTHPASSTRRR